MTHHDVFNGDADGICALHQLRLDDPRESTLVTGTKRENVLLPRVRAVAGDAVTALDIAMPGNRAALVALLEAGVRVRYVDHHEPGDVPAHRLLDAVIDTAADVCTSVLVDRLLEGRQRRWAVVAAFGDNLPDTAARLAATLSVDAATVARWRELGECLNYNAYGLTEDDLVYRPADLYRALAGFRDPSRFIDAQPHFARLRSARADDVARARSCPPERVGEHVRLHRLPDAAWARRVSGSHANTVFNADPGRAHVIAVPRADGGDPGRVQLSVRLPAGAPVGAHEICRPFGGGGRRLAAGIDALPVARLPELCEAIERALGAVPGANA